MEREVVLGREGGVVEGREGGVVEGREVVGREGGVVPLMGDPEAKRKNFSIKCDVVCSCLVVYICTLKITALM